MNILIIEDEPATAARLEKLVKETASHFNVLAILDTVEDCVNYFNTHTEPDLVFMDIHLADGNSFEIFERSEISCPVIFTTAYDQYAIKAFKVNSIDYLLKPVKREELVRSLNKFRQLSHPKPTMPDYGSMRDLLLPEKQEKLKRFMIKTGQTIKAIEVNEVAYFFVENKIVYAVSKTGQRHIVDFTMDYLEKHLDESMFFRISRNYIIGFHSISNMTSWSKSRIKIELQPKTKTEVVTSTDRSGAFKKWLSGS